MQNNDVENTDRNNKENKLNLSEGLILAAIPAAAYLTAFLYEYGYTSYFSIPIDFIKIDFLRVFILTTGITSLLFILALIQLPWLIFSSVARQINPLILQRIKPLVWMILFSVILILLIGVQNWQLWIWVAFYTILIALVYFGLPLITQRQESSYLDKLNAQQKLDDSVEGFYDYLIERFGLKVMRFASLGLLLLTLSYLAGTGRAFNQVEYPVLNTSPETVVLRIYGDNLIGATFNRTTKEMDKRFFIVKVGDLPNLVLNIEEVGPLKPSNSTTGPSNTIPIIVTPTVSP